MARLKARRANRSGNVAAYAAWRTYLTGAMTAPAAGAAGYGFGVLVLGMNTQEARYLVGYLWGVAVMMSFVAHATVTTGWAKRTLPAPAAAELQPA